MRECSDPSPGPGRARGDRGGTCGGGSVKWAREHAGAPASAPVQGRSLPTGPPPPGWYVGPPMVDAPEPPETRAEAERWVGRVVDERYQITRLIGVGGMGLVFEAEQLALRKPVALKLVQADFAGNGEVATRFAREAMATARIDHPHVASAIDYGQLDDGTTYLVMQLVRGENLAE